MELALYLIIKYLIGLDSYEIHNIRSWHQL